MWIRRLQSEQLDVTVDERRTQAGAASAARFAERLTRIIQAQGNAAIIPASAPSQNDRPGVTVFHMDEYVGLAADHLASIRRYICESPLDHAPFAAARGIGENGHLSCSGPRDVKVELDHVCHLQPVHGGCFATLAATACLASILRPPHRRSTFFG